MRNRLWTVFVAIVMSWCADSVVSAQGLQSSPYAAPSLLQGEGLSSALSNPFDRSNTYGGIMNQSSNHAAAASTPKDIPNLQAGYVYFSSKNWRAGYLTLDYILPVRLSEDSMIYGEVHSEFQTTATKASRRALDQTYLSAGGGYRTLLRKTTLIGANGFYDAARFSNQWMGSGGAGLEMATLLNGHDALDVNFNWYANLANVDGFVRNPARNGPANFDLQVGYSHQIWHGGPDLRLYGTAYKFDDGGGVYGWQAGLELKSANWGAVRQGRDRIRSCRLFLSDCGRFREHRISGRESAEGAESLCNAGTHLQQPEEFEPTRGQGQEALASYHARSLPCLCASDDNGRE